MHTIITSAPVFCWFMCMYYMVRFGIAYGIARDEGKIPRGFAARFTTLLWWRHPAEVRKLQLRLFAWFGAFAITGAIRSDTTLKQAEQQAQARERTQEFERRERGDSNQ